MSSGETTGEAAVPFWRIVLAATAVSIVVTALKSYQIQMLIAVQDASKVRPQIGYAMAITALVAPAATVLAGFCSDRFGSGRTLAAGVVAAAFGLELFRYAQPGIGWNSAAALLGVGAGAAGTGVLMAIIAQSVPAKRLLSAVLVFAALPLLGKAIWQLFELAGGRSEGPADAALLAGVVLSGEAIRRLLDLFEWRGLAGIAAVALVLCWTLRTRQMPTGSGRLAAFEPGYALLVFGAGLAGATTFMTVYLYDFLRMNGLQDWRTGYACWAAFFIGGLIGLGAAVLTRSFPLKNQLAVLALGRTAAFLCFLLLPLTRDGAIAFFLLLGTSVLPVAPLSAVLTARLAGTRWLATLLGIVVAGYSFGAALGNYSAGLLYDASGSYDAALWLGCLLSVLAAAVSFLIREPTPAAEFALARQ